MEATDILRSANLLLQQHGANAYVVAAKRIVELRQLGDDEGTQVWVQVMRALDTLVRGVAPAGSSPN
jgi:hypothetical protein